ncbi:DNA-binding response regulator [Aliivibrio fischeri]|nr:DNA-binding response regulator [Aliivibrio fischeri]MUL03261.1 DNA-binding response regulator [Aliivibrio fischeri]MUL21463.1 DNA-binding response regulator [Aliivibrio fischeri]MUL23514.1 DNA-binding response regulator [Aliivibrio fischeri]
MHTVFESLLITQSNRLLKCEPSLFEITWRECAVEALELFKIDRLSLFPNSLILFNEGKLINAQRQGVAEVQRAKYSSKKPTEYLKLLSSSKQTITFSAYELKNSNLEVLRSLYQDGARWHCIIPLSMHGKVWGAATLGRLDQAEKEIDDIQINRLKMLCEMWLCYWQHSVLTRNLQSEEQRHINEGEQLLLLSKKQTIILNLLATGHSAKECAEKLNLSPRTIESHKYRMLTTLQLENHSELIQFALRNDLGKKYNP